jgi:uncharacterized membrane protein YqhA
MHGGANRKDMLKTLLSRSRIVVALAVIATFAGSIALLVMSTVAVLQTVWTELDSFSFRETTANHIDHLGVKFIQIVDTLLLGTILYIVSIGLYQLFFDNRLPVPRWLQVHDLIELKRDLISVTIVLLGVTFLGEVVDWNKGDNNIFFLGAGVALVVAALGFILWLTPVHGERVDAAQDDEAANL